MNIEYKLLLLYLNFLQENVIIITNIENNFRHYGYHPIIAKYVEWSNIDEHLGDDAEKLFALHDENGFLPEDLQTLFNEWLLKRL